MGLFVNHYFFCSKSYYTSLVKNTCRLLFNLLFLKGFQGLRRPVGFHKYFFNCFFLIFEKVLVEKAKVESIRLTELEKHTRHFKNLIVNPTVLVDAKETLGTNYVIDA